MLLNEKITIVRKMNNLTQEAFAEELGVSRQAVSKWESGMSIPDVQMLLKIADLYSLTLDQLVRDDFELPVSCADEKSPEDNAASDKPGFCIDDYIGKICDVSMNSFRYSAIRNIKIVGMYKNMVCFEKNGRYGFFNKDKSLGIVVKKREEYIPNNELVLGKCTVYVNKGTYFGGNTYILSSISEVSGDKVKICTGEFTAYESLSDISVILMSDKIKREF